MLGRSRGRRVTDETVLVVGLGLFGSAAARELAQMQVPLIAVTEDHEQAVKYADEFDHVIVDAAVSPQQLDQLREWGARVTVASEEGAADDD